MIIQISELKMRAILQRAQDHVINLLRGQEECLSLLSSAHLVVIEENSIEGCPYRIGGTCFIVRFGDMHFVVSTLHGCRNLNYSPESILYLPDFKDKTAFSYDAVLKGKYENANDKKEDFVLLKIGDSESNNLSLERITCKDIKMSTEVCLKSEVKDLFTRGFLSNVPLNAVEYDNQYISMQAYSTNGIEYIKESSWEGCFFVKFQNPKPEFIIGRAIGMSGAPVFGLKRDGTTGLFGMIIEHDSFTDKYLVLGVEALNSAIRKSWKHS